MNREDVMRMAMRAGLLDRVDCSNDYFIPADAFIDEMEKLANLAYEAGRKDENEAATELRRLHEVNAELVEALGTVIRGVPNTWDGVKQAKAVLAKAQGEKND